MTYDAKSNPVTPEEEAPSLRDRQVELTRQTILQALVAVIVEQGIHEFSVQNVADRAGVSHRTVYRHFPSREALLEGLAEWLQDRLVAEGFDRLPEDAEGILEGVEVFYPRFEAERDAYKAMVLTALVTGHEPSVRRARTEQFQRIVRQSFPHLPEDVVEETALVIRSLASARQWLTLTEELGMEAKAAGRAVRRAVAAILEDLRREDRRARKRQQEED